MISSDMIIRGFSNLLKTRAGISILSEIFTQEHKVNKIVETASVKLSNSELSLEDLPDLLKVCSTFQLSDKDLLANAEGLVNRNVEGGLIVADNYVDYISSMNLLIQLGRPIDQDVIEASANLLNENNTRFSVGAWFDLAQDISFK